MPRILVIDDQPHVRATISIGLQAHGFEVVGAESGAVGLKEFEGSHFDVAIVDIYMPGMDGMKIIKMLRSRAPHLPIVAISGVPMKASGRTALDFLSMAPNNHEVVCLQKPFRSPELLQAIQNAMGYGCVSDSGPHSMNVQPSAVIATSSPDLSRLQYS